MTEKEEPPNKDMDSEERLKSLQKTAKLIYLVFPVFCCLLPTLCTGFVMAFSVTAIPFFTERENEGEASLTFDQRVIFVSVMSISTMPGTLCSSFISEAFGKRAALAISSLIMISGWIFIFCSESGFTIIIIGRILNGIGCGLATPAAYNYLSEISVIRVRGGLAALNTGGVNLGYLLGLIIGANVHSLRTIILVSGATGMVFLLLVWFIPESPLWLVKKRRLSAARNAFQRLRGTAYAGVEQELDEMLSCLDQSSCSKDQKLTRLAKTLLSRRFQIPFWIMNVLFLVNAGCGSETISYYAFDMIHSAGIEMDKYLLTIYIQLAMTVGYCLSTVLMERLGRRQLYIMAGFSLMFSFLTLATCLVLKDSFDLHLSYLPPVCMIAFALSYGIGFGPVGYTLNAELFPSDVHDFGCSSTLAIRFVDCFFVLYAFPHFIDLYGLAPMLVLQAGIQLVGILTMYLFVPETMGLSMREIDSLFVRTNEGAEEDVEAPEKVALRVKVDEESELNYDKAKEAEEGA